jgi:hypothetical protein
MVSILSFHNGAYLKAAQKTNQANDYHSLMTSIVFSALSLESYLNELPKFITECCKIKSERTLERLRLYQFLIQNRVSNEIKLTLAYYSLLGHLPKGEHFPSEVRLLFKIRNIMVHPQPTKTFIFSKQVDEPELPNILKELIDRKIIKLSKSKQTISLSDIVVLRQIVPWAIELNFKVREKFVHEVKNRSIRNVLFSTLKFQRSS